MNWSGLMFGLRILFPLVILFSFSKMGCQLPIASLTFLEYAATSTTVPILRGRRPGILHGSQALSGWPVQRVALTVASREARGAIGTHTHTPSMNLKNELQIGSFRGGVVIIHGLWIATSHYEPPVF